MLIDNESYRSYENKNIEFFLKRVNETQTKNIWNLQQMMFFFLRCNTNAIWYKNIHLSFWDQNPTIWKFEIANKWPNNMKIIDLSMREVVESG